MTTAPNIYFVSESYLFDDNRTEHLFCIRFFHTVLRSRCRSRLELPFFAGVGSDFSNWWSRSRLRELMAPASELIKNWSAPPYCFITACTNVPILLLLRKPFLLLGGSCVWSSRGGSACWTRWRESNVHYETRPSETNTLCRSGSEMCSKC